MDSASSFWTPSATPAPEPYPLPAPVPPQQPGTARGLTPLPPPPSGRAGRQREDLHWAVRAGSLDPEGAVGPLKPEALMPYVPTGSLGAPIRVTASPPASPPPPPPPRRQAPDEPEEMGRPGLGQAGGPGEGELYTL